jgi:two-component system, OmpR family, alkaline phosphatase synthesis response regulator PhoP
MSDAWIISSDDEPSVSETVRTLAEMGFRPLRVDGDCTPVDQGASGGVRRPEIAIVIGRAESVVRLRATDGMADVPVVLTVDEAELGDPEALIDVDELLVHPFRPAELRARIARARKQVNGIHADDVVRIGTLEIDLATYVVSVDGTPVDFTYMEYELLRFLATHPNRVFSREALLTSVWGYDYYGGARTVDVHVRRVRAKLGTEHAHRLKTVRSVGYRFEVL